MNDFYVYEIIEGGLKYCDFVYNKATAESALVTAYGVAPLQYSTEARYIVAPSVEDSDGIRLGGGDLSAARVLRIVKTDIQVVPA